MTVAAATVLAHSTSTVLAKASTSSNDVTPGVLGFLVVAAMGLALYFLLRSMSRKLRKIPPPPPDPEDADPAGTAAAGPARSGRAQNGSARRGPDLPDRLGQSPPAQRR